MTVFEKSWFTIISTIVALFFSAGCSHPSENLLDRILMEQESEVIQKILADQDQYRVQVLYTQVDRDEDNNPQLTTYSYRQRPDEYFYPASTVKLPVILLALEDLNEKAIDQLDRNTVMLTDSAFKGQTWVRTDTTALNGLPSVEQYIKKILLVSDNDGFNRLYEYLGQDKINDRLRSKGYHRSRIIHRLSLPATLEQNAATNPVRFLEDQEVVYSKPLEISTKSYLGNEPVELGNGEMIGGNLRRGPKDFRTKNRISLKDLHETNLRIIFPQLFVQDQRFNLSPQDYSVLRQYMSEYPRESKFPKYDSLSYSDSYVKFFIFGDSKDTIPSNIRIFNKVGVAYGFVIDNAYIIDFTSKVEFFLSAVIYVNENQIFNDNQYQYESLGYPFLAELGRAIYRYELVRRREHLPDLTPFNFEYD